MSSETQVQDTIDLMNEKTRLEALNAEMLKVLKAVQPYLKDSATISHGPRPRALLETVDAAIAKADATDRS